MIEAELKARVKDVEAVRTWLRARAEEEEATYHDTYYDWPDRLLDAEDREVRLRTITSPTSTTYLLTYKQPPIDVESGSKPEHETTIADPVPVDVMLRDLGLVELVRLTKRCENYRFRYGNRTMLATLVTIPEIDGIFIEIESHVEFDDFSDSITVIRTIMTELDVIDNLDSSTYTETVLRMQEDKLLHIWSIRV